VAVLDVCGQSMCGRKGLVAMRARQCFGLQGRSDASF
jgi:hypothetical protein